MHFQSIYDLLFDFFWWRLHSFHPCFLLFGYSSVIPSSQSFSLNNLYTPPHPVQCYLFPHHISQNTLFPIPATDLWSCVHDWIPNFVWAENVPYLFQYSWNLPGNSEHVIELSWIFVGLGTHSAKYPQATLSLWDEVSSDKNGDLSTWWNYYTKLRDLHITKISNFFFQNELLMFWTKAEQVKITFTRTQASHVANSGVLGVEKIHLHSILWGVLERFHLLKFPLISSLC